MLSPKNKRLLGRLVPHFIFWLTAAILYLFLERGIMGSSTVYPSTGNTYHVGTSIIGGLSIGIVGGLIFGLLEELLFKNLLRNAPFAKKIVFKTLLYLSILGAILTFFTTFLNSVLLGVSIFDPLSIASARNFVTDFVFLSIIVYSGAFISISLFVSETIDHIGYNAITNFFTGKYTKSKVEKRVFMFLDMRSSTTIAEKLGHEEYYKLLNTYYQDMTEALIATSGEIYQYVGDEIVVSWKYAAGIKNSNCIKCFFQIRDKLEKKEKIYEQKFGIAPKFKAGLHCGEISTGQVGIIKKEILFTGDVLNTTARIQSLCNEQGVDLLISQDLNDTLNLDQEYTVEPKGSFELRGRDRIIALFTILKADNTI